MRGHLGWESNIKNPPLENRGFSEELKQRISRKITGERKLVRRMPWVGSLLGALCMVIIFSVAMISRSHESPSIHYTTGASRGVMPANLKVVPDWRMIGNLYVAVEPHWPDKNSFYMTYRYTTGTKFISDLKVTTLPYKDIISDPEKYITGTLTMHSTLPYVARYKTITVIVTYIEGGKHHTQKATFAIKK